MKTSRYFSSAQIIWVTGWWNRQEIPGSLSSQLLRREGAQASASPACNYLVQAARTINQMRTWSSVKLKDEV